MVRMAEPGRENATGKPDIRAEIMVRSRTTRNTISMAA